MTLDFNLIAVLTGLLIGYITTTGVKSQWVRVIDIFVYSSILFYVALYKVPKTEKITQATLLFMGATTMSYNLYNYYVYSLGGH